MPLPRFSGGIEATQPAKKKERRFVTIRINLLATSGSIWSRFREEKAKDTIKRSVAVQSLEWCLVSILIPTALG
jgi:hypothetical protein